MMASQFTAAAKGLGRSSIDLPVAGFAALAVAFVIYAMPGDFFSTLVGASGLPALVPAAAPPLGATARIAVALAGALGVFAAVFLLLRAIDRSGGKRPPRPRENSFELPRPAEAEVDEAAPRLRRWDAHPDAPARRPIFAGRDFGEPVSRPADPPAADGEREPVAAPEPQSSAEAPGEFQPEASGREPDLPAEPPVAERIEELSEDDFFGPELEAEEFLSPAPASADPDTHSQPPAAPVEAVPDERKGDSIAALVARLEQGLARRAEPQRKAPAEAPVQPASPVFSADDDRLGSAIRNLEQMVSRDR